MPVSGPHLEGLHPARWSRVLELAQEWCQSGRISAISCAVGRSTGVLGSFRGGGSPVTRCDPIHQISIFLVASITKPIVATGALLLLERGLLSLGDRVSDYIPEFAANGKIGITVRHLLTHTSGLPDMLPNNRELRQAHAPLSAFVAGACEVKPDFPPGRGVQYQSMGFAVLSEIIARVSLLPCREFLRTEIFEPLGMHDTVLGAPDDWFEGPQPKIDRVPEIRVPADQRDGTDWNWNSRYWRQLGAPWGGLLTTVFDLSRFAQMMLGGGRFGDVQLLSRATVDALTRNQLDALRDLPEADRRCRPWALGWRLNWPAHSANFGDLLGPRAYGHWGATGTALWIDPDRDAYAVILTTEPQEPSGYYLARLSNAIAAAIE